MKLEKQSQFPLPTPYFQGNIFEPKKNDLCAHIDVTPLCGHDDTNASVVSQTYAKGVKMKGTWNLKTILVALTAIFHWIIESKMSSDGRPEETGTQGINGPKIGLHWYLGLHLPRIYHLRSRKLCGKCGGRGPMRNSTRIPNSTFGKVTLDKFGWFWQSLDIVTLFQDLSPRLCEKFDEHLSNLPNMALTPWALNVSNPVWHLIFTL